MITKHHSTLFGSFSNTISNELKGKLWNEIKDEVNKVHGRNRSVKSIQAKWQKMTSQVKQKSAEIRRLGRLSGKNDERGPELTQLEEQMQPTP